MNSIILRYKSKQKKLGFRSKLSADDLSYLIANHYSIKGKILGLKDTSDNFYQIKTFCNSNLLKPGEIYHVIVESNEIPQTNTQSTQKHHSSSIRNSSSIHQNSEPVSKHIQQSESRYLNSQSHHKNQFSQNFYNVNNQQGQLGLSSMITVVNNFKVWEENFQDPQEDRTSVIALIEDKDYLQSLDPIVNNSLINPFNNEWINVMNSLADSYGDRVDYFCCNIKAKEEIQNFKVFPSVIVYKGGQKVMEISLQNQAKTILRLLERFLNTASGMLAQSGQITSSHFPQNQHAQALLLMEQSVQQTDLDTGDIITIPANIPDQRELLNLLDVYHSNNQISTLDYFIFKCKILEKFDLFMRGYYEVYSEFDQNSFKDYLLQLANQQNNQDKLDVENHNSNINNQFENKNFQNNRPQSSAQPQHSGARRTPSRQQTSNFGSDSKLGFSQEQLMKAVIELETGNLLEMPILTQIKKLILAENQEIISIIEGFLSNSYNKNSLSEKLKKYIIQTNHFDRPTSPWPKKEKVIQMFQNIVSKNYLTEKEVEVLKVLIESNNQLLMGTFSDGRLQDELVKSLKRIASQYMKNQESINQQTKQRSANQSGDLKAIKNFENIKVNNFFQQQQQFQQIGDDQENQNLQQDYKKEYLNKKLDFQNSGDNQQSQDELQIQNIADQYLDVQGSDQKQKRIPQYNNAHQSSSSSAQFANIQRQILSASPVIDNSKQKQIIENQPHFRAEENEDSPLHTIQLHQQLNQGSSGPKPTNLYNIITSSSNNNNINSDFQYNHSEQLQKKLDQMANSQQQSNDDLQIFNSNAGQLNKETQPLQQNQIQNIAQIVYRQQNGDEKNKLENTDTEEDLQNLQDNQRDDEEDGLDEDEFNQTNTYLEFMDDHIDQFNPEDYGMAVYLLNQQNEDILQLFEEITQHNQLSNATYSIMPIKIMVSSKFKEILNKNFKSEEVYLIEANKQVVTTSIFAVYQSFRVQTDLDTFIQNLKSAIMKDQARKQSLDESDDELSSNRQAGSIFKGYQEKIHPDEILQESNAISPIDQSLANNQHYIQDNQPSFSNQQNYYQQSNDSSAKPVQISAEFSYRPQEVRQEQEQNIQERSNSQGAKKAGLISLHNAQSETEIQLRPLTNESSDSSIRKRLRTESLQVETNAKFSPRNKKQQSKKSNSPDRQDSSQSQKEEEKEKSVRSPTGQSQFKYQLSQQQAQQQPVFGLINLKKLQQIDVNVQNTGMNVQDNDLNEILSHEISEFYSSYIYNENDRIYDEIVNLSTTTTNPLNRRALEVFSILYQVNDLDVINVIEEYKEQRNLQTVKEKLTNISKNKKRSCYSSIQSVNNKIGKFNLFKRLLKIIEKQYQSEQVDFYVQQYLFLHDDVVTLAAFEAYCINKNWREFVENLVLIGKMSLIKFNLNQTEISKLNQYVLDQLYIIYAYGRYLRSEEKKDLEIIIKQDQENCYIQQLVNKYDAEEINQTQLVDGICQYAKDISKSLRKDEYFLKMKYSCPSIEEREELKKVVEQYRNELSDREITNLELFNQLIYSANKNLLGALCLHDYMKDKEDFLENLAMIYHYETSNDMKRIIKEFSRISKWDQNQVKFLIQKVDDDEPVLMGAYYHYKKNENDKDEKLELKETFELYLNSQYKNSNQ
ncbi:hypothetical protein ABPG74_015229 [Tetrahymena malaccensis]